MNKLTATVLVQKRTENQVDSDVGDIDLRCWWRYVGDFLNVLNPSPTSQTCHQDIRSPTSVANIHVTENQTI